MVYTFDNLKIGDSNFFEKTITDADILLFSAVSGDGNPLHVNEVFAKKSRFGRRIVHGALTAALISAALTRTFPISIYLSQYAEFVAPVYIGDTVRAVVTCNEIMEKRKIRVKTECFNQNGELVVTGEAIIKLAREIPFELRGG